jgi:uncharacterized protein YdhG (YjbR/CyaY superfamily)
MAKTDFKSVAEYLATLPKETRTVLERVRTIIRKAVPKGEEGISYQIPTVKLDGRAVIYFAGWKEHYSVYPATEGVVTALERELAGYELSKGTIRFPLSEPVPVALIARIAKIRAQETSLLSAERLAKRSKVSTRKASSKAEATNKKRANKKNVSKKSVSKKSVSKRKAKLS